MKVCASTLGREVESRKIYGRSRPCKGTRTTFDVTMPDVHLYGLHYNLHCARPGAPCACTRVRKRTKYRVTRAFTRIHGLPTYASNSEHVQQEEGGVCERRLSRLFGDSQIYRVYVCTTRDHSGEQELRTKFDTVFRNNGSQP